MIPSYTRFWVSHVWMLRKGRTQASQARFPKTIERSASSPVALGLNGEPSLRWVDPDAHLVENEVHRDAQPADRGPAFTDAWIYLYAI